MRSGDAHRIAVLVSGGVDSAILLAWACARYREVFPLFVRCGMRWEKAELFWLKKFLARIACKPLKPLTVLESPVNDLFPGHWSLSRSKRVPGAKSVDEAVFLPGRNLLLLSKAAVFCYEHSVGNVSLGTLSTNPFADAHRPFFRAFEKAFRAGMGRPLQIVVPFLVRRKAQIVRAAKGLPLELTFSCLNPRAGKHCGHCNKCAERISVLPKSLKGVAF